jgi:hypothetical protein
MEFTQFGRRKNLVPSANEKIKDHLKWLKTSGDSAHGGMAPPGITLFELYCPMIPKIGNSVVGVDTGTLVIYQLRNLHELYEDSRAWFGRECQDD